MAILVLPDDLVIESIRFRAKEAHCCSGEEEATLRVDFFDGGGGNYYELRPSDGFAFNPQEAVQFVAGMLAVCDHNDGVEEKWCGSKPRSDTPPPPPLSVEPKTSDGDAKIDSAWLRSSPLYYQTSYTTNGRIIKLKVPGYSTELCVHEPLSRPLWGVVNRSVSGTWINSATVEYRSELLRWCRDHDIDLFPEASQ